MDDVARWLKDKEALGHGKRSQARALLTFKEMLGRRFEKLVVAEYVRLYPRADGTGGEPVWRCKCDCGGEVVARQSAIRAGDLKSCGKCNRRAVHDWSDMFLRKLALSLEFEGSLGVYDIPQIAIGVRDYAEVLVEEICVESGVGAVAHITKTSTGSKYAQWQVSGYDAARVAEAVLPYMVCKYRQADALVEFPAGSRRERVTQEMKAIRARLAAETSALNARGPRDPSPLWAPRAAAWLSWVAGASLSERMMLLAWSIEWEGEICINERANDMASRGVSHQVLIGLGQSAHRQCLLGVVQGLAGGVGNFSDRIDHRPGNSPVRRWAVHALGEAKALARDLIPFMRCKKRLAELVTEFPEHGNHGNTPVSEEVFRKRRALAAEAKKLNAVLAPVAFDAEDE